MQRFSSAWQISLLQFFIQIVPCPVFHFLLQSFENHVKGRPHEWMLSKLDESNKLVVDLLRHQVRVSYFYLSNIFVAFQRIA